MTREEIDETLHAIDRRDGFDLVKQLARIVADQERRLRVLEPSDRPMVAVLPAGDRLAVEAQALLDAERWGEARAKIAEAAAALGESDLRIVGMRTMIHFADCDITKEPPR